MDDYAKCSDDKRRVMRMYGTRVLPVAFAVIVFFALGQTSAICQGGSEKQGGKDLPMNVRVITPIDMIADQNRDGLLNDEEFRVLTEQFLKALAMPHASAGPVDGMIDANQDGFVDDREIRESVKTWYSPIVGTQRPVFKDNEIDMIMDMNGNYKIEQQEVDFTWKFLSEPMFWDPRNVPPDFIPLVDRNKDGRADQQDIGKTRFIFTRLIAGKRTYAGNFEQQPEMLNEMEIRIVKDALKKGPHKAENEVDKRLDMDGNGFVEKQEIEEIARKIDWMQSQAGEPVMSLLDELADTNGDGRLAPDERESMKAGLERPHKKQSAFDARIDFNGDGSVQSFEIDKAKQLAIMQRESDKAAGERYKVLTELDRIVDMNNDGFVTPDEIQLLVEVVVSKGKNASRNARLFQVIDFDKDGKLEDKEIADTRELVRPHPIRGQLDKKLDANRDDFVDEVELGIVAGFSGPKKVTASVEERIEAAKMKTNYGDGIDDRAVSSAGDKSLGNAKDDSVSVTVENTDSGKKEFQKKLDSLKGKKVAVMDLSTKVDSETAEAILDFLSNAFVNTNMLVVVDRSSIDKILKEQGFQSGDLADQTKAVKVGKLAGADYIVTGSLRQVSGTYYLTVQILSSETGIVDGSCVSKATDSSQFYDMANDAVYKLFSY